MKAHHVLVGRMRIGPDRRVAGKVLGDQRQRTSGFPAGAEARKARQPRPAAAVGGRSGIGPVVVTKGAQLEAVGAVEAEATVVPRPAVDLVIEADRRASEATEQRRGPVGQREAPIGDQHARGVVPAIGRADQRNIAGQAAVRAQPAGFEFGADRAQFLAHPGVDGRRGQRVDAAPAGPAILEGCRQVKGANLELPADRSGGERPVTEPELAGVERVAVVVAIGVEHPVHGPFVGQPPACRDVGTTQPQPVVRGVIAQRAIAAVLKRRRARRVRETKIDGGDGRETILGVTRHGRYRGPEQDAQTAHQFLTKSPLALSAQLVLHTAVP